MFHRGRGGLISHYGWVEKEQIACHKYLNFRAGFFFFHSFWVQTIQGNRTGTAESQTSLFSEYRHQDRHPGGCSGGCWGLLGLFRLGAQRARREGSQAARRESLLFLPGRTAAVQLPSHRSQREFYFNGAELG